MKDHRILSDRKDFISITTDGKVQKYNTWDEYQKAWGKEAWNSSSCLYKLSLYADYGTEQFEVFKIPFYSATKYFYKDYEGRFHEIDKSQINWWQRETCYESQYWANVQTCKERFC